MLIGPDTVLVEVVFENVKMLTEVTDLGPITLDVEEIAREVRKRTLKDLGVQGGVEARISATHDIPGFIGVLDREIHGTTQGTHKTFDFGDVVLVILIRGHKLNRAEATAAKAVELVDTKHANRFTTELLQFDPLKVGEADASVNLSAHDSIGDVHTNPYHLVLGLRDASLFHQVVDHDLSEVADVANILAS
mmetsp:Transcript_26919/g.31799  ORF Transcript_26919/g.31799 Transcript_26919/m.31799 type:complete len:192 (-) Transcript_26919:573-1148(-)